MKSKYRYQFPIGVSLLRWGLTIAWRQPIVKIKPYTPTDPEDSMLIYLGMFDED